MGTKQDAIKATLMKSGIGFKDIDVYGSQIVVTVVSRDTADKWAMLLAKFSTLRGITKSVDETTVQRGSCLCPTVTPVYRVFSAV